MASPVVAGSTSGTAASSATLTASLVMPANVGPKDVLHAILHIKGAQTTVTWPAGWVATNELTLSHTLSSAYKFADGTEGGTTVNVTHDVAGTAEYHARRITGASHNVSPVTTLLASSINPPSRAWTWGSSDILGIAMAMCADFTTSAIGFPGTYPGSHLNNTNTGDATQRLMSATAGFTQVSTPEDPSAFSATGSASSVNKAGTVVFPPAAPQFIASGAGSARAGTGTVTPALPAGHIADDILLLFCQTKTAGGVPSTPTGWTAFAQAPLSTGTQLTAFWKRDNGSESAPVVTCNDTDHTLAVIACYRGVHIGYDPGKATASQSTDHTTAASFAQNTSFGLATTDGEIFDNNSTLVLAIATFSSATSLSTLTDSNAVFAAHAIKANVNTALGGTGGGAIGIGDAQKLTGAPAGAYPLQPIFFASGGSSTISYYAIPLAPEITPDPAALAGAMRGFGSSAAIVVNNTLSASGAMGRLAGTIVGTDAIPDALVAAGAMGSFAASAVLTNGEYLAASGAMGSLSGSIAITETDVLALSGAMAALGGSIVAVEGNRVTLSGAMAPLAGSVAIALTDQLAVAGSMQGFGASITIDQADVLTVTAAAAMEAFAGSVDIELAQAMTLAGAMGRVGGSISIAEGVTLAAAGAMGRLGGDLTLAILNEVALAGAMRPFAGRVRIRDGQLPWPTDPFLIIDVAANDRVIVVQGSDRAIAVAGLDRSIVIAAVDRVIVAGE